MKQEGTRITQMTRMLTDNEIRVNPSNPCHPCAFSSGADTNLTQSFILEKRTADKFTLVGLIDSYIAFQKNR